MNQCILFEDIFEIKALNENGKKFERGSLLSWSIVMERMLTVSHHTLDIIQQLIDFTARGRRLT